MSAGARVRVLELLLHPILPVFAILFLGFAMGRAGLVQQEDARALNRFAMTLLIPVLVFGLIARAPVETFSLAALSWYLAAEVILFSAGYLLAAKVLRREPGEAVLLAFCGVFANNVFFVLPIALLLYGEAGVLPVTTVITLDASVTFGGAMMALELIARGRVTPLAVLATVVRTPLLLAMLLGGAFSLSGLVLPAAAETFVDFNGAAAAPVALFALGVVLSRTPPGLDAAVVTFSAVKLLAFPALVWLGLLAILPAGAERGQFLLASAGPAGTMAFSMALHHGVRTDTIARIIILTSVLSLFSLAVLA